MAAAAKVSILFFPFEVARDLPPLDMMSWEFKRAERWQSCIITAISKTNSSDDSYRRGDKGVVAKLLAHPLIGSTTTVKNRLNHYHGNG